MRIFDGFIAATWTIGLAYFIFDPTACIATWGIYLGIIAAFVVTICTIMVSVCSPKD